MDMILRIARMVEEYVHNTKEEMWEKGLRCDGEIDMGWEHFSEEDKADLLEDDEYYLDNELPVVRLNIKYKYGV